VSIFSSILVHLQKYKKLLSFFCLFSFIYNEKNTDNSFVTYRMTCNSRLPKETGRYYWYGGRYMSSAGNRWWYCRSAWHRRSIWSWDRGDYRSTGRDGGGGRYRYAGAGHRTPRSGSKKL